MRKIPSGVTTAVVSLAAGVAVAGCAGGGAEKEPSADQLLERAYETMDALETVTVDASTAPTGGDGYSSRLTTDLKGTCTVKITWTAGGVFEQIRIGETDYVRPDRAYLERWSGKKTAAGDQKRWIKAPADKAGPGEGLVDCTWPFAPFGTAAKGKPTEVDGRPALPLKVTDKENGQGVYTFYVATEGKPYLLKVAYKGADYRSTTSFSAFDEPLDVRPPADADVLETSAAGR
ncbi:hypothetical protein [Streptomyces sp. NRRL WC-3549]|uniref:hypothetical protein n=1 Tax=Streptomyces sp. NRRL WC-3549 TaxID=1463925 RepID=UPI0004CBEF6D|nr:hypothetical protein [Streptomyces sp. NRRL WC-3549]